MFYGMVILNSKMLEIEEAMNLQMKAEREKRAIELTATANKEATIREAEEYQ